MIGAQEVPIAHIAEALQEVTSSSGLTLDDLLPLLLAGMTVADLLSYVQAAKLNRLN